jgi:hypothetical protein
VAFLLALVGVDTVDAQQPPVSVLTHHYDNGRTGWNNKETTLTTANVNPTSFGLLHTVPVDDQVDSQPLVWVNHSGQAIVYVVTASNTLYGLDPGSGTVVGTLNLGPPVPQTMLPGQCGDNGPNLGVEGTPVIQGDVMYLITYTLENNAPVYRVRAINLSTLQEQIPGGVVVAASHTLTNGATYTFNSSITRQRPALLYANGNVYAGFGSFCDFLASSQRGWLLGWNSATLKPLAINQLNNLLATEPTVSPAFRVSLWMSGAGIAADEQGNLYFVTGNSGQGSTYNPPDSIQESVVKMSPDLSSILGIFTPSNYLDLDNTDQELGAGGILVIPPQPLPRPYLATAAGKDGNMYLLNRRAFGGLTTLPTEQLGTFPIGSCFCGESYFVGADGISRIVSSGAGSVMVWKLQSTGTGVTLVQESQSQVLQNRFGFFTSVSSNGRLAGSAIIWAITHPGAKQPLDLVAMDATNSHILYASVIGPWSTGTHPNQVPVVANGRVLAASYKQVAVYGLGGLAAPANAQLAPSAPQGAPISGTLISGTVATISGSTFQLKTSTGVTGVDATQAEAAQLAVDLYVGRKVTVRGTFSSVGVLVAEAVYAN